MDFSIDYKYKNRWKKISLINLWFQCIVISITIFILCFPTILWVSNYMVYISRGDLLMGIISILLGMIVIPIFQTFLIIFIFAIMDEHKSFGDSFKHHSIDLFNQANKIVTSKKKTVKK